MNGSMKLSGSPSRLQTSLATLDFPPKNVSLHGKGALSGPLPVSPLLDMLPAFPLGDVTDVCFRDSELCCDDFQPDTTGTQTTNLPNIVIGEFGVGTVCPLRAVVARWAKALSFRCGKMLPHFPMDDTPGVQRCDAILAGEIRVGQPGISIRPDCEYGFGS